MNEEKYLITSEELWNQINERFGDKGGVYKLHCLSLSGPKRIEPLSRLLNVDNEGVLYIGKAISYLDRVINLKKSLLPKMKSQGHICGRRYWNDTYKTLRVRYPAERLCISFVQSDSPEKLEKEELASYCKRFGEPPPLNPTLCS